MPRELNPRSRALLVAVMLAIPSAIASFAPARADTLLIERTTREAPATKPSRGATMDQVRARFGAPSEELAPVGGDKPQHPPITRWVYPGFIVYFERARVIDSVAQRSTPTEQGPKPVAQ